MADAEREMEPGADEASQGLNLSIDVLRFRDLAMSFVALCELRAYEGALSPSVLTVISGVFSRACLWCA